MEHEVLCTKHIGNQHHTQTDAGDVEGHRSKRFVSQLKLFTRNILKVWLAGKKKKKINDGQETDGSYGMSHLLKSCLLSSCWVCRPKPLMLACVCSLPIPCCFSQRLNAKDRCFMLMFLLWNLNVCQTHRGPCLYFVCAVSSSLKYSVSAAYLTSETFWWIHQVLLAR